MLASGTRSEPYPHEYVRPIPLYIRGAGVATGRYEASHLAGAGHSARSRPRHPRPRLVRLRATGRDRPRPAGVRLRPPGQSPAQLPLRPVGPACRFRTQGYYSRFVLQQVTLDALLTRCDPRHLPAGRRTDRSARRSRGRAGRHDSDGLAAPAATRPGRHDSSVTLSTLLPHIAAYRDDFYQQLLAKAAGPHGDRLARRGPAHAATVRRRPAASQSRTRPPPGDAVAARAPGAAVRPHGPHRSRAASRPTPCASPRPGCSRPSTAGSPRATTRSTATSLQPVVEDLEEVEDAAAPRDRVRRPGRSVEHRRLRRQLQPVPGAGKHGSRLARRRADRAGRANSRPRRPRVERSGGRRQPARSRSGSPPFSPGSPQWWDQFATASVEGVKRLVAKEIEVSANLVSGALNAWHKAGAAAGDVAFWRLFVDQFDSSKAFQLVIEALLDHGDTVAARALMMQWVNQRDRTPLEDGRHFVPPAGVPLAGHRRRPAARRRRGPLAASRHVLRLPRSQRRGILAGARRCGSAGAVVRRAATGDDDIPFGEPRR